MDELQTVVLRKDLAEHGLRSGDVGAVVYVHSPEAYEVEFVSGEGHTVAVVTLESSDLRPIQEREILHVRDLAQI